MGIEQAGKALPVFAETGQVAGNHRRAQPQCLDQRQAETFRLARQQQGLGPGNPVSQIRIGTIVDHVTWAAARGSAASAARTSSEPAPHWPMHHQLRHIAAALPPGCAATPPAAVGGSCAARSCPGRGNSVAGPAPAHLWAAIARQPAGRPAPAAAAAFVPGKIGQIAGGGAGIDDDPGGLNGSPCHPSAMPFHRARAAVVGMINRDQVVDQIDRAQMIAAGPAPVALQIEIGVADVEIEPPRAG